jgi:translation elongation factor EF-Tu-like GTPase
VGKKVSTLLEGHKPMNKAMIDSYLRNLAGQVIGAVMIVAETSGVGPIDFSTGEWLLVANAIWASAIPTVLRYINKSDPAFGRIAEVAAAEVGKKLSTAASTAKKPAAKKAAPKK